MTGLIKQLVKTGINVSPAILLMISSACSNQPKVIEADVVMTKENPFKQVELPEGHQITFDNKQETQRSDIFHKVVVQEVLPTSKYVYLRVTEASQEYWIATKKMDVKPGAIYYYKNGLLKTNFESKEYKRTFDKLYLVSSIVPESHGTNEPVKQHIETHAFEGNNQISTTSGGAISIAELVSKKDQLEGKMVTLKGICTKVNAKIMGRNWIHLKDGSLDDFDLVITSSSDVPLGHEVEITGVVALKKDFGSGYFYDLIVENGKVSNN